MEDNTQYDPINIPPKNTPKENPRRGILGKLWNGEYSLPFTFWIFGIVVRFIMITIMNILEIITSANYDGGYFVVWILFTVLDVCILVGMWRSASKYTGFKLWPILVKAYVIIVVVFSLIIMNQSLHMGYQY